MPLRLRKSQFLKHFLNFEILIFVHYSDPGHGFINGIMGMIQQVVSAKVNMMNAIAAKANFITGHFTGQTGQFTETRHYTG